MNKEKPSVRFMGDSITDEYGHRQIYNDSKGNMCCEINGIKVSLEDYLDFCMNKKICQTLVGQEG